MADPTQATGTTQTVGSNTPLWYDQLAGQFGNMVSGGLSNVQGLTNNWYDQPLTAGTTPEQQQIINQSTTSGGQWSPYYAQGWGNLQGAGQPASQITSGLPTGQQNWQTAAGMVGQAGQGLQDNSTYDPNEMQRHLSPYLGGVLENIQRLGLENLQENVLPGVNQSFVGAGAFGSQRNQDFTQRALRNTQREILGAQAQAGNQAFGQAANDYLNWGQLGTNAAGKFGDLATTLANIGTTQATTPASVFGQQTGALSSLGQAQGQYGIAGQGQTWQDLLQRYGLQEQGRTNTQAGLDAAYKDWQSRVSTPYNLMGALSQIMPQVSQLYGGAKTSVVTPNAAGTSGMGDILSILAAINNG